jgi:hypothetical protein
MKTHLAKEKNKTKEEEEKSRVYRETHLHEFGSEGIVKSLELFPENVGTLSDFLIGRSG